MPVQCMSATAGLAVLRPPSAPRYRALMLPIAPSVGRTTTRRPGNIWTTLVSGVLAHKSKKERLKPLFFLVLDTFHARQSVDVDRKRQASHPSSGFSFGRLG